MIPKMMQPDNMASTMAALGGLFITQPEKAAMFLASQGMGPLETMTFLKVAANDQAPPPGTVTPPAGDGPLMPGDPGYGTAPPKQPKVPAPAPTTPSTTYDANGYDPFGNRDPNRPSGPFPTSPDYFPGQTGVQGQPLPPPKPAAAAPAPAAPTVAAAPSSASIVQDFLNKPNAAQLMAQGWPAGVSAAGAPGKPGDNLDWLRGVEAPLPPEFQKISSPGIPPVSSPPAGQLAAMLQALLMPGQNRPVLPMQGLGQALRYGAQ